MKSKKILILFIVMMSGGVLIQSCKKLPQNTYSVVPITNFYQTPAEIAAGLAPAYTAIQKYQTEEVFQFNEAGTDEMIIPTRGLNWYDGGEHVQIWQHTVDQNNVGVDNAWGTMSSAISQCNFIISVVQGLAVKPANSAQILAELSVLRDYDIFLMTDFFGPIPLITTYSATASQIQVKRADVYTYLITDLLKNVPLLTTDNQTSNAAEIGHMNQWAGDMLLAKLYLNAQVYTGTADWANAEKYANLVINSGKYSLQANFFDNFTYTNRSSVENIFTIPFNFPAIPGNVIEMYTLQYDNNQTYGLTAQPYNGYCAPTAFYDSFADNDARKKMWEVGQQYTAAGAAIPGSIISKYVLELSNPADSFAYAGARSIKYQPQPGTGPAGTSNDGVRFRLADAYMMAAEAELRLSNVSAATANVNIIRARAGLPGLGAVTLDQLLAERGWEFAWEGWRRNDLIRFEVASGIHYFTGPRAPGKVQDAADNHTFIFPIPQPRIDASNGVLKQNPGYGQ